MRIGISVCTDARPAASQPLMPLYTLSQVMVHYTTLHKLAELLQAESPLYMLHA